MTDARTAGHSPSTRPPAAPPPIQPASARCMARASAAALVAWSSGPEFPYRHDA